VFSDITTVKRAERELLVANEKLKLLANRDGLTELLTRRAFDETLELEFKRAKRSGAPLSLLLLDVDWFKRYNDRYGHPEGDECLRAVSRCLQDKLRRPADSAARYGGEEFAAILPETDADGAFAIGEAVLHAIRALQRPHEASEHKIVTASIGVATFDGFGDKASVEGLLKRADEALYGAKAASRNRVHGWRPRLLEASREAKRSG
jgi:diguanylate cyclase (GGDEF)-like protein